MNEPQYSHPAAICMQWCVSISRAQQEAAKLVKSDLESTKTYKPAIVRCVEDKYGFTKASLSVLEGLGCAVLEEVGGLGGHALQHQMQAALVAGGQGEAQDDRLHLIRCLWAFTSIATLPARAGCGIKIVHEEPSQFPRELPERAKHC